METEIEVVEGQGTLGHLTYYALNGEGKLLGVLELCDPRAGLEARLIRHIEVAKDYRRQGIASKLWHHAKAQGMNPIHAIDKTEEGTAWATAIGD